MRYLKQANSKTESRTEVAKDGARTERGGIVQRAERLCGMMTKVLKMETGDGCITL